MTHHPDALVEAVARALWGPGTGSYHPDAVFKDGTRNWEMNIPDARNVLDAIAAQGLVVVPAEPTAEMVDAGDLALYRLRHGRRQPKPNEGLLVSYRAMLAARPGAADGQEGVGG
jgi:hypothetical protein